MYKGRYHSMLLGLLIFFALPASTNYEMHDFGFGGGGTGVSDSSNYSITGVAGEVSSNNLSGSSFDLGPGLLFVRQSHTPATPTFSNDSNHYNKLQFILNTGNNPGDTLFAIAISSDDFATTQYIQSDNTVGTSPAYQNYAAWGGVSGEYVVGLSLNTTYKIKVKAVQTKYTESAYSQTASATTLAPTLAYDIDVSSTDTETGAPYVLQFGTLSVGSITTATEKIWIDLDTNAEAGAFVYASANANGLTSSSTSHTIPSVSADLNSSAEGFGLRIESTNQNAGTLTPASPYDGSNQVVGQVDTTSRTIFTSNHLPISGGRGAVLVKAKASPATPSAADYNTIITLIASATF